MYNPNANNILLTIRSQLDGCSYNQNMKDYLANLIMSVMNFPKKTQQVRHFIKTMGGNRIMMVWYPMSVPFMGKNYNVPLQIYITKNMPYEPPQIFLEVTQGSGANAKNTDIDPNNNRIMTNSLRNWSQYSVIDNVMNEIFASFSRTFPIYKKSPNDNQIQQQQGAGGGGGIYNLIKNEVFNLYQNNRGNNNQGQGNFYGFQPPTKNIYGKAMTREGDNNQQQPNSFGGGIYGNNNQQPQPNSFGGGIYGNNNNNYNNQQPNSFGGGIYGNNNNNQQSQPNSFGGGIYGNNNNQQPQPNSFGGGIYGNNNNNNQPPQPNSFGGGIYGNNNNNQNQFGAGGIFDQPDQPKKNPDDEFKDILINEVSSKISNKLVTEKQRLYNQNQKMKNYKTTFSQENEKLNNFVNAQNQIKAKCDEDMTNMNHALSRIQDQINRSKSMLLNEENCINLVDIPDPGALKIIAEETCLEEMILVVRKGFERKKISFDQAIMFMRNSSRDLFAIKFLKDKAINKYKN